MSSPQHRGTPFEAEVRSADASSGVAVPIYNPGNTTALTLGADEYLEVTFVHLVTVAGEDAYVLIGSDATIGTAEAIVRGTYAANGGFAGELGQPKVGAPGETLWVVAPAGVVDVQIRGTIRKVDNQGTRPSWRESQVPGA